MAKSTRIVAAVLLVAMGSAISVVGQDEKKREPAGKLVGHQALITGLAVFADGKRAATVADDGVIVWDLDKRAIVRKHPLTRAHCVAVSADGRWIAGGGLEGDLVVWEAESGKEHSRVALKTPAIYFYEVAFSPDSRTLAAVDQHEIRLYDVAGKKLVHHLASNFRQLRGAAFAPDGKTLSCAASEERTFRPKNAPACLMQWSTESGKLLREFPVAISEDRLHYAPDGKTLIGKSRFLVFLDADTGKERRRIERHLRIFALSRDGTVFLGSDNSAAGVYELGVYDTATGKRIARLPEWSSGGAFLPDSRSLLLARGKDVHLWNVGSLPRD